MASLFKKRYNNKLAVICWLAVSALLVASLVEGAKRHGKKKSHDDDDSDGDGDADSTAVVAAAAAPSGHGRASCAAKLVKLCCGGRARAHNVEEKLVGKLVTCMSHSIENILNDIRETPATCCAIPGVKEHCEKKGGPENTRLTEAVVNPFVSRGAQALAARDTVPQCSWNWMERCCGGGAAMSRTAKSLQRRAGLIGDIAGCLLNIWKIVTGRVPEQCCRLPLFGFFCKGGGIGGGSGSGPGGAGMGVGPGDGMPGRKMAKGASAAEDEDCD